MHKKELTQEEKRKFIDESLENGQYFKDGFDFYLLKYTSPIAERNLMLIIFLLGVFCVFMVYSIVMSFFPLKEAVPVIIDEKDSARYLPVLRDLKENPSNSESTAELITKYLIENYIIERESYDYRSGDINEYNVKLAKISNNSSPLVLRDFKLEMDRNKKNSPLRYFGKNIYRNTEILSFVYLEKDERGIKEKITSFFGFQRSIDKAVVNFRTITYVNDNKKLEEYYKVDVKFNFGELKKTKGSNIKLDFAVTEYKKYKLR